MLYALLGIAGITSFIAIRTYFPLFKFGASVAWIAVMAYLIGNYSGENWVVIAYLGCIVMIVAFPLSQLGRDIKRSQDQSGAFSTSSEGFDFKLPEWLKGEDSPEQKARNTDEELAEYKDSMQRALGTGKYNSRRRR